MMHRMPNAADLTSDEFASLTRHLCHDSQKHQARLVELGLIQARMGGLFITPMGRMVARA
jgi:hypothetical protein